MHFPSNAAPLACRHEPYEGKCIHCNAPYILGRCVIQPDSLAVAQALEEWESTFDCNSPREAYAEMKQAVLAHANAAAARALEAVKKIGRDLQLEPIPEWSQPFRDGYREGISEYVHRINAFALTSAAETRRQVKKRRAARKQAT